tara:strand:+ start:205 stop:771 length:567 start_codon:yes stop_codon:yes gene_type:complete
LYNNNTYVYRFSKPASEAAANLEVKIAKAAAKKGIAPKISNALYKNCILMFRMEKMYGNLEELTRNIKNLDFMGTVKDLIREFHSLGYCHKDIAKNPRNILYKINQDGSISLYLTDFTMSSKKNSDCRDITQLNYRDLSSGNSPMRIIAGDWYALPTFGDSPRTPGTPKTPKTPKTPRTPKTPKRSLF